MKTLLFKTEKTDWINGRLVRLYRVPNPAAMENMLREAAGHPDCAGPYKGLSAALDYAADRFADGGEPWDKDEEGHLYDFSDFEVTVIKAAAKAVRGAAAHA